MHQRWKPESKDLGFRCLHPTKQVSGHDFSRAESRPKKEARDRAQAKERAHFADAQKIVGLLCVSVVKPTSSAAPATACGSPFRHDADRSQWKPLPRALRQ